MTYIAQTSITLTESQISDLAHSDDAGDILTGTFANARISQSSVTQHQAALSITESQISDLSHSDDAGDILTGTFPVARGGTGLSTIAANRLLYTSATSVLAALTLGSSLLITAGVLNVVADTLNQRLRIANNGSLVGTRRELNLIPGTNVTLNVVDNAGSNRVDATINATASSVFGTQRHVNSSEGVSSTTSSGYQNKVTLTTPSLPAGTYRIEWYLEMKNDSSTGGESRCVVNGTERGLVHTDTSIDNDYHGYSGFYEEVYTAGVRTHSIEFRAGGGTTDIRRARLVTWRVA